MKKEYIKPVSVSIECHTEMIMAVSGEHLNITDKEADEGYEVLGRQDKWDKDNIWNNTF